MLFPQPFREASGTPGGSVSPSKHFGHSPMAGSSNSGDPGTPQPFLLWKRSEPPRAGNGESLFALFKDLPGAWAPVEPLEGGNLHLSPFPAWSTVLGTTRVLVDMNLNFDFRIVL